MLNKGEHQKFWKFISECHEAKTVSDLELIVHHVRKLFPHEMAFCGIVDVTTNKIVAYLNVGYPAKLLSALFNDDNQIQDPFFFTWLRTRRPYFTQTEHFEDVQAQQYPMRGHWLETLREFGVANIAVHGLMDISGQVASYFSFCQLPELSGKRDAHLLSVFVPHLHLAFVNALQSPQVGNDSWTHGPLRNGQPFDMLVSATRKAPQVLLTVREIEVLHWAYIGKTNWEIGTILGITEFTVKNHMRNIMRKLKASNRTHAVSKAMDARLLHQFAK